MHFAATRRRKHSNALNELEQAVTKMQERGEVHRDQLSGVQSQRAKVELAVAKASKAITAD